VLVGLGQLLGSELADLLFPLLLQLREFLGVSLAVIRLRCSVIWSSCSRVLGSTVIILSMSSTN
jgi:hypothetical protein